MSRLFGWLTSGVFNCDEEPTHTILLLAGTYYPMNSLEVLTSLITV